MEQRKKGAIAVAGFILLCLTAIVIWAATLQSSLDKSCWSNYDTEQAAIENCEGK